MQTINICTTIVLLTTELFIFGSHNIDATQTIESLYTDTDFGITIKIDDKGLIDCSGLICSNKTEYCKIMEVPQGKKGEKMEIRKQCVDKNGKHDVGHMKKKKLNKKRFR